MKPTTEETNPLLVSPDLEPVSVSSNKNDNRAQVEMASSPDNPIQQEDLSSSSETGPGDLRKEFEHSDDLNLKDGNATEAQPLESKTEIACPKSEFSEQIAAAQAGINQRIQDKMENKEGYYGTVHIQNEYRATKRPSVTNASFFFSSDGSEKV